MFRVLFFLVSCISLITSQPTPSPSTFAEATHNIYFYWNRLTQVYCICTLVLLAKYKFSLFYGGFTDFLPEPSDLPSTTTANTKSREVRQFENDCEHIPLSLVVFWAAYLVQCLSNASGHGMRGTAALTALFVLFTGSRFVYTLAYIFKIQPWRTVFYYVAIISTLIAAAFLVVAAFETDTRQIFPQSVKSLPGAVV